MRRRWTAFLAAVTLLMCLAAPVRAGDLNTEAERLLLSRALSLCGTLDACADDPEYGRLYRTEGVPEEMARIGRQDWTAPKSARLYIIKEKLFSVYLSGSSVREDDLSAEARDKLRAAIPGSLVNLINTEDSVFIAASSALRCGTAFSAGETDIPAWSLIYLTFDGGYDALCSFVRTEEGIVSAYLAAVKRGGMEKLLSQLKRAFIRESDLFDVYELALNP